jgi:glycosyltransferase involved in cell wall biosynthesis
VNFLGALEQKDLPRLYRSASLLVAPFVRDDAGDQEGLPVVLMEAIGCGCPVIAGAVEGIEDLLGSATADITVRADDAAALAAAVLRDLDDPAAAAARAARVRAAVADRLDWSRIAAAYAEFLQSCVRPRQ